MPVIVKWGRERLSFDLPSFDIPLGDLRSHIAQYIQLGPHDFKLIHKGALLKDDSVPLSSYHIQNNSTIVLVGSKRDEPQAPIPAAAPPQNSQQSTISTIQSELAAVRKQLTPAVESFLVAIAQGPPSQTHHKEHTRLGELLLQSLLRLDAIVPETQWEDARRERKTAVKEVQSLLDRLDAAWAARSN
ncbi:hypothetical protein AX16_010630 [Volvariella volvacea WC 439]|nr:hypothetical protein AX16_010630 [Volvariella volvacea WC 439]